MRTLADQQTDELVRRTRELKQELANARRSEQELLVANNRLLEVDQIKNGILDSVSYEMQTALMSLSVAYMADTTGSAEVLYGAGSIGCMRDVQATHTRMAEIMSLGSEYFHWLGRDDRACSETANLVEASTEAYSLVKGLRSAGVRFQRRYAGSEFQCRGGHRQLVRVIRILLENAAQSSSYPKEVTLEILSGSDRLLLSVRDTGLACTATAPDRFDAPAEHVGEGEADLQGFRLGLVHAIVRAYGGSFTVEQEDKTVSWTIDLPVAKGKHK